MEKLQYQIRTCSRVTGQMVSRGIWQETTEELLPSFKQVVTDMDERYPMLYHVAEICDMKGNYIAKISSDYDADIDSEGNCTLRKYKSSK